MTALAAVLLPTLYSSARAVLDGMGDPRGHSPRSIRRRKSAATLAQGGTAPRSDAMTGMLAEMAPIKHP